MTAWYRIDLTVGTHSWTLENGDAADGSTDVLGGLEIGWVMPVGDLSPAQPEPMDASFSIRVADADNVQVDIGDAVAIEVRLDPAGPVKFAFYGQVGDMSAVPSGGGGMTLSIVAVDYTADERPIGLVDWTQMPVSFRIEQIWTEAGAGAVPAMSLTDTDADVYDRAASKTTLPAAVAEILPSWIGETGDGGFARYILSPNITAGGLDAAQNFCLDPLPAVVGSFPPAEFVDLVFPTGVYGLTVDPDPANFVIDGDYVRRSATWRRRKYGAFNLIVLTDRSGDAIIYGPTGMESTNDRFSERTVVAELTMPFDLGNYLPGLVYYFDSANATNRWEIESFTYELSRHLENGLDPDNVPLWYPDHAAAEGSPDRTACYQRPVVVTGIPDAQNLGSGDFYAGQLTSARLTITGGNHNRMTIGFALRRTIPNADPDDALTPAGLTSAGLGTVRVDQLDPDFTVYDYRLAQEA